MEERIICNCCGKEITVKNGIFQEDYLHVVKNWGYFSEKDGRKQEFFLCESCYDRITGAFLHPVDTTEMTELL